MLTTLTPYRFRWTSDHNFVLVLFLAGLKLMGAIDWPWIVVTLPVTYGFIIAAAAIALLFAFGVIAVLVLSILWLGVLIHEQWDDFWRRRRLSR
jgi:hypothetical protein